MNIANLGKLRVRLNHLSRVINMDDLEKHYRLIALKKAALVMNALAEGMKEQSVKDETKSLAWTITWAINELETKI